MNAEQIELARHALGLPNKQRRSYRNHFVAGEGHPDFAHWDAMAAAGDARKHTPRAIFGGDCRFTLTRQGALKALKPGEALDPDDFPPTAPAATKVTK